MNNSGIIKNSKFKQLDIPQNIKNEFKGVVNLTDEEYNSDWTDDTDLDNLTGET